NPQGGATPTPQAIVATLTSAPTLTFIPSPTLAALEVESPTPTDTIGAPTVTPTTTETPGPYQHTIKEGDSLITIVQEYGYTDFSPEPGGIIDQIVRMNENIPNADTLPGPGSIILIPRQTATPTPASTEAAAIMAATNVASVPNVQFSEDTTITDYTVQSGDT